MLTYPKFSFLSKRSASLFLKKEKPRESFLSSPSVYNRSFILFSLL